MSWKAEVVADKTNQWVGNVQRFATKAEANDYASDLAYRWVNVRDHRVVESTDHVNCSYLEHILKAVA